MDEICDYCGNPCLIFGHYMTSEVCQECFDQLANDISDDDIFDCGCRFMNSNSSAIELCDECSKLPCHNP